MYISNIVNVKIMYVPNYHFPGNFPSTLTVDQWYCYVKAARPMTVMSYPVMSMCRRQNADAWKTANTIRWVGCNMNTVAKIRNPFCLQNGESFYTKGCATKCVCESGIVTCAKSTCGRDEECMLGAEGKRDCVAIGKSAVQFIILLATMPPTLPSS